MATVNLTDRFCANVKAKGQTDYFDEGTPGLALRVGVRSKRWTLHHQGRRITLGAYPGMTLAGARAVAIEVKSTGTLPAGNTFQSIAESYLATAKLRTIGQRRYIFEKYIFPALGHKPIDEIKRGDIIRLLDGLNGDPIRHYVLACISKLFNWHAVRDENFRSPIVRGMAPPAGTPRQRVLSDDELRTIWHAAGNSLYGAGLRLILLTACRKGEVAGMQWSEVTGSDLLIPVWRYKTNREHLVPLSAAAQAILAAIPRTADKVFPARAQFSSLAKARFDKACGISGWRVHDLRRTARSLMSRAGVQPDHAERCLGHVISRIRGTYDRHEYHAEKQRAFEALAQLVDRIVTNKQADVHQLRSVQ